MLNICSNKMDIYGNKIFYILSEQQHCKYKPSFPFDCSQDRFDVLSRATLLEQLKNNLIPDNIQVQKILCLAETLDDKIYISSSGCRYVRITFLHKFAKPIIPISQPMCIKKFSESNELAFNIYDLDYQKYENLCREIVLINKFPLKYIKNAPPNFVIDAILNDKRHINYILDEQVSESVRIVISRLFSQMDKSDKANMTIKESFIQTYEQKEKIHPEAKKIIDDKIFIMESHYYLFDDLGPIRDKFIGWLNSYSNISDNSEYELESIGYADECHKRNRHFKKHLHEITKERINVTDACNINDSCKMVNKFIQINRHIFDFLIEIGFNIKFHARYFWRRGTDIKILEINDLCNSGGPDSINIFVINPLFGNNNKKHEPMASDTDED